ncbi:hypothetical protein ACFY2R_18490 [Micromonospora olivasterospora]|uniref:IclR family transcriptional regulator domain-containing protein n=1 Tax=Micromonospora olivasterospora TaxID=1880 RepID=UPI00147873B6|nr:hypothetical protein [Micromonospora olivasterospora]
MHLGVLDGDEVVHLEKLTARGGAAGPTRVGGQVPATCTAVGKSLLPISGAATVRTILVKPMPRARRSSMVLPRLLLQRIEASARRGWPAIEAGLRSRRVTPSGLLCRGTRLLRPQAVAAVSLAGVPARVLAPSDAAEVRRTVQQIADRLPVEALRST